ncbi:hypothetical protein [Sphingomonas sp. LHG3443-2]|uniref:hypothetical protein n=1 Tax=Sphingomonas sp. LHG3443-2 TaxID=2804639 RepID=UPI003CEE6F73
MSDPEPTLVKDALILSWTVRPATNMPGSTLNEPGLRLSQYLKALLFYIHEVPQVDRILILENSGYDFTTLRSLIIDVGGADKVAFISTDTNYDPSRGKGYAEFRMYDEGLSRATGLTPSTRLWKITGRLIVENLAAIISSAPNFNDLPSLYCDLRKLPFIPPSTFGHWMEARLFAFNYPFYERHFQGRLGKNYIIEEDLFTIVFQLLRNYTVGEMIVPRFKKQPIFRGQSGYSSKSYLSGKHLLAHHARRFTRQLVPSLWL